MTRRKDRAWYPVRPSNAIMRLKQWAFERTALCDGRTTCAESSGFRERRQREADSRNVRVMDFERALSHLDPMHQQALVLTYRDNRSTDARHDRVLVSHA
jgi:hypothetical protein